MKNLILDSKGLEVHSLLFRKTILQYKVPPKKKKEKFLAFKDLQEKRNANLESRI